MRCVLLCMCMSDTNAFVSSFLLPVSKGQSLHFDITMHTSSLSGHPYIWQKYALQTNILQEWKAKMKTVELK